MFDEMQRYKHKVSSHIPWWSVGVEGVDELRVLVLRSVT